MNSEKNLGLYSVLKVLDKKTVVVQDPSANKNGKADAGTGIKEK